ncbi:hypothetical protein FACS1894219_00720 [Clostridia bacterium]|nr:hypothetical protein FACS1894219_00720 [Clostridia bacterium]
MKLLYSKPASNWNEALPLGNGRLGAMIYGGKANEILDLNEDSVWHGNFVDRNNPDCFANLPEVRRLLKEGRIGEAQELALHTMSGIPEGQRHYQPIGKLSLSFKGIGEVTDFTRTLDLDTAVAGVSFKVGEAVYKREAFISNPAKIGVLRLTVSDGAQLEFTARLDRNRAAQAITKNSDTVTMTVQNGCDGAVTFCAKVRVKSDGAVRILGEDITVKGASWAEIYYACETTFYHGAMFESAVSDIISRDYNYDILKAEHIADYKKYYDRVKFNLGAESDLPTDERLKRITDGGYDLNLVATYFQFGRYLMISGSREGTLPLNLQGIWNNIMLPPWDSKYTININAEMNYWPAETANLSDLHKPLFDLIKRMEVNGRKTAKVMYNSTGWLAHHNTDIWGDTAPQDRCSGSTYWYVGGAWLCLHIWEHYLFTGNVDFLREHFYLIKGAVEFLADYLVPNDDGNLVVTPSISPENTYILESGESGQFCESASMDNQIMRQLFNAYLEGAKILNDTSKLDYNKNLTIEEIIQKIPATKLGKYGQIMEWNRDYEEAEPGHRHISHLFALYPGNEISPIHTKELSDGARMTLKRRLSSGGGHTGWSRAWIINMWARLHDGEKAFENLNALLGKSTLISLLDNHPPFQIDGNFGATAAIIEMLLQSQNNELHLLPALPALWKQGKISGLRARGGYTVDIEWDDSKLAKAAITADKDGSVKVRYGTKCESVECKAGVATYIIW